MFKSLYSPILIAGAIMLQSTSAFAQETSVAVNTYKANKVIITKKDCSDSLSSASGSVEAGFLATLGISLADLVLGELFSFADKHIEKRKKELSATFGGNSLLPNGLGVNSSRCIVLLSGKYYPDSESRAAAYSSPLHPKINNKFYTDNRVNEVYSLFAYDIEASPVNTTAGAGISTFGIVPFAIQYQKSNAKRNKKDYKSVISTITFETMHKDAKKAIKTTEKKLVFDHSKIRFGDSLTEASMQQLIQAELIDADLLSRPMKVNISIAETEDESAIDKILASLYESEKDNIKSTIRGIWGTEDE